MNHHWHGSHTYGTPYHTVYGSLTNPNTFFFRTVGGFIFYVAHTHIYISYKYTLYGMHPPSSWSVRPATRLRFAVRSERPPMPAFLTITVGPPLFGCVGEVVCRDSRRFTLSLTRGGTFVQQTSILHHVGPRRRSNEPDAGVGKLWLLGRPFAPHRQAPVWHCQSARNGEFFVCVFAKCWELGGL